MNSDVEIIKERLDIVDVVSEYVALQKAGKNMRGLSPFTNEKSPSFFVSPERQLFHCFSSGKGGDMFTFIQEMEGTDFRGSLGLLADRAGVTLSQGSSQKRETHDVLYNLLEDATLFFQDKLGAMPAASEYLQTRGITTQTIVNWRLGYALNEWRALYEFLLSKGYQDADIKNAGLIKTAQGQKGERLYDTFRGRIMFPLFDVTGRVIAYSGRILEKDAEAPKYVNSPDTTLFNKSHVLYGLDKAKTSIKKQDYTILVEGQVDVVMSHQSGLTNTVASSGTALTPHQLTLLRRYSSRLIVAFDSDRAGFTASSKNATLGMQMGFDVKVAALPIASDPADMLKNNPKKYKAILASAEHVVDFYVLRVIEEEKDERTIARRIRVEVLPLLVHIKSAIEKAHFVKRVAQTAGIPEEAIWYDFKEVEQNIKSTGGASVSQRETFARPSQRASVPRKDSIVRDIYGIILWQRSITSSQIEIDEVVDTFEKIVPSEQFKNYIEEYNTIENELIFEAETKYPDVKNIKKIISELLEELAVEYLRDDFSQTMKALALAEKKGDKERAHDFLVKCQELTKQLAKHHRL